MLGLLIMSADVIAGRIDLDGRFFAVLVYDCLVALLAFASLFFDPEDLIAASFILNGGLDRFRQVLHLDLRFLMFRLRRHAKGESSADYSCCNKVLRFHGYSYLTMVRPNLMKFYSVNAAVPAVKRRNLRARRDFRLCETP
jgi:hypothetical protein